MTDGEYNASLRKGDSVEELTDDRAAELLAERRAKGPAKKASKKKPATKDQEPPAKRPGVRWDIRPLLEWPGDRTERRARITGGSRTRGARRRVPAVPGR